MKLDEWARRWNVSPIALVELRQALGVFDRTGERPHKGKSEGAIVNELRLEATRKGCRLWRNNVGATYTMEGAFLRYGLANESSPMNKQIKSADLIGIRPIVITASMIGCTIGQFVSREVKWSNWRYTGNDREQAQLRWAELILAMGGDACFATGQGTL